MFEQGNTDPSPLTPNVIVVIVLMVGPRVGRTSEAVF